jgi:hypothetical protein
MAEGARGMAEGARGMAEEPGGRPREPRGDGEDPRGWPRGGAIGPGELGVGGPRRRQPSSPAHVGRRSGTLAFPRRSRTDWLPGSVGRPARLVPPVHGVELRRQPARLRQPGRQVVPPSASDGRRGGVPSGVVGPTGGGWFPGGVGPTGEGWFPLEVSDRLAEASSPLEASDQLAGLVALRSVGPTGRVWSSTGGALTERRAEASGGAPARRTALGIRRERLTEVPCWSIRREHLSNYHPEVPGGSVGPKHPVDRLWP